MAFPLDPNLIQQQLDAGNRLVAQRRRDAARTAKRYTQNQELVSLDGADELRSIWTRSDGDVPEWPS